MQDVVAGVPFRIGSVAGGGVAPLAAVDGGRACPAAVPGIGGEKGSVGRAPSLCPATGCGVSEEGAVPVIASKHILLTTYRASGEAVGTPVWFAEDGDRLLVWTGANTGKVRRIRVDDHVTVCPCTATGRPTGEVFQATARFLPAEDGPTVQRLLDARYGVAKRVLDLYNAIIRRVRRRPRVEPVYLAIIRQP